MDAEQGTQQWHLDRAGCATASCFADIIAVSKSNGRPLKAREDYMWKLAGERFYGTPTEQVFAKPMEWGKDLEPYARQAYEVETGNFVIASGFVPHKTIPNCGASPDGLIMTIGGLEIKCPKDRRVHMQTWLNGMPPDHIPQVQGNIWVNDREWWDFVSYDPRAPEAFRLYIQRVPRDNKYILALESHVVQFLGEVEGVLKELYARKDRDIRGTDTPPSGTDSGPVPPT
jgi:hypothetical protein